MRRPLLAAVAAGFVGACGVSVAMSLEQPPPRSGSPMAARERPASAPAGLRELAPVPALQHEPRSVRIARPRALGAAPQAASVVPASPPAPPPPTQERVTTPSASAPRPAAPKEPAPNPAPEFDSSEEVFESAG